MSNIDFPQQLTAEAISRSYVANADTEHRPHLGASLIGRPCERALWFGFRWAARKLFDGRMLRLFETGHLAEPRFAANLRAIGVDFYDESPDGGQWRVEAFGGHFGGSLDGAGIGFPEGPKTWAVCEFKTSCTKVFKKMQSDGVKATKPEHFTQMQIYMGKTGMQRAMYIMVCKETDELYSEWVEFDQGTFDRALEKAGRVIAAAEPPMRISKDPSYFTCKYCDYADVCHGNKLPEVNCRTCAHSTPELDGKQRWSCARWKADVPLDAQRKGCGDHVFIPIMLEKIGHAVVGCVNDAGATTVEYQGKGVVMQGPDGLTSAELAAMEDFTMAPLAWQAKSELAAVGVDSKVVA